MGKKHDEIVMSLTKDKIRKLFVKKLYGEQGCWSSEPRIEHKINEIENMYLTEEEKKINFRDFIKQHFNDYYDYEYFVRRYEDLTLEETLIKINKHRDFIRNISFEDSVTIEIEHEHLITNGTNKYKREIGFLDIICKIKPISRDGYCCYKNDTWFDLIIDAKQLKDFDDTGGIIRQIKRYKEFYDSDSPSRWALFCDEEIPKEKVEYIETNGIYCLWDGKLNEVKEDGAKD